jgi:WD40 repeat protein
MGSRYNDSMRIWDARTGKIVNALGGPNNDITDFSFSDDGQFLVGAAGGSAWIWDLLPGKEPQKLELYPVERNGNLNLYTNTVTAVAMSLDKNILAVGTSEHTLKLYDRKTLALLRELPGHAATIRRLRFSPDGHFLVSIDQDGIVIVWDVDSGKQAATLDHYGSPTNGALIGNDGNLISWGEGNVWTLNVPTLNVLQTTRVGAGFILGASPAGNLLAVYEPFSVSLYDAQSCKLIQKLEGEAEDPWVEYYCEGQAERKFYAASFSQDGGRLATAGAGGVWYYDTVNRRLLQQYPGSNAQKLALSPDGQSMLTSLYDQANPVSEFDMQTGDLVFSLGESGDFIQSVFSPDGRWIGTLQANWNEPVQLKIFNTTSQKEYKSLSLDDDMAVTSLAINPAGDFIAVGKESGEILLIGMNDMKIVATLTGHRDAVEHLVFSLDGNYLISIGADGTLRTWGLP